MFGSGWTPALKRLANCLVRQFLTTDSWGGGGQAEVRLEPGSPSCGCVWQEDAGTEPGSGVFAPPLRRW
jgi:hypothetical protein